MNQGRYGHGGRQDCSANPRRSWKQNQRAAGDFHDSGEIPEPLANPNLIEESNPWRARSRRELVAAKENERHGDPGAQDPFTNLVAGLAGGCLFKHRDTPEAGKDAETPGPAAISADYVASGITAVKQRLPASNSCPNAWPHGDRPNPHHPWPHPPLYNSCLLTEDQCERFEVVLVSPRNPLNIGAAARAMANFGFKRLTVVAPFDPTWREARSAVGAPELLQGAKSTECLAEAVAQCTLVAGTGTLTYRKPEQPVVSLPQLAPLVRQELEGGGRVAIVFGSEKHGLTRDDLSYCHALVEIPTDPKQPSMNLGQAVAVCLYELATRVAETEIGKPSHLEPAAASGKLELLAGLIEESMVAAGYSPRAMQPANRHDLRLLLRRLSLSARDTRRMMGLFRRILWRLRHPSVPKSGPN